MSWSSTERSRYLVSRGIASATFRLLDGVEQGFAFGAARFRGVVSGEGEGEACEDGGEGRRWSGITEELYQKGSDGGLGEREKTLRSSESESASRARAAMVAASRRPRAMKCAVGIAGGTNDDCAISD